MDLKQLLQKFNFRTGIKEKALWRFIDFQLKYDRPLKMQRLDDNIEGFFKFEELIIDDTQVSDYAIESLREQIVSVQKHYKEVEEQRLKECKQLNSQLKSVSNNIDDIITFFDEMNIDLIKKKLKLLSKQCENSSY